MCCGLDGLFLPGYIQLLCCNLATPAITPGWFTADHESGVTCTLPAVRPVLCWQCERNGFVVGRLTVPCCGAAPFLPASSCLNTSFCEQTCSSRVPR